MPPEEVAVLLRSQGMATSPLDPDTIRRLLVTADRLYRQLTDVRVALWQIRRAQTVGDVRRAVNELRTIMEAPPSHCRRGHRLGPGYETIGMQVCDACGGHRTYRCNECGAVTYVPPCRHPGGPSIAEP